VVVCQAVLLLCLTVVVANKKAREPELTKNALPGKLGGCQTA